MYLKHALEKLRENLMSDQRVGVSSATDLQKRHTPEMFIEVARNTEVEKVSVSISSRILKMLASSKICLNNSPGR
jgi:hypothetical protein